MAPTSTPSWIADAVIYQLNVRVFTTEGTFQAAIEHLPRLRDLGVSVVMLTPIHPIGEKNRKGRLGSAYAVQDYYRVNPEYGTFSDFRDFVLAAHELGLRVFIDWVANHSAWDNVLVTEHPGWFRRALDGQLQPSPWWDWDDTVELDYAQSDLRKWMADAMVWWIENTDIDGFRCDAAGMVPTGFWIYARQRCRAVKDIVMLAEWEARDLHYDAFDVTYSWTWHDAMSRIASGSENARKLRSYYSWHQRFWPPGALRLTFVSNHDMNAWNGTEFEQFGAAHDAAVVLSMIGEGIPLIYNGQESGLDRRLAFFDDDDIQWRDDPNGDLYRELMSLRRRHRCLWNGSWGSPMCPLDTGLDDHVLAFTRGHGLDRVLAVFNFSDQPHVVTTNDEAAEGRWELWPHRTAITRRRGAAIELPPWGYQVFEAV